MYPFTLLAVILGAVIGLSGKVAAKEIGLISRGIRTFARLSLGSARRCAVPGASNHFIILAAVFSLSHLVLHHGAHLTKHLR